MHKRYSKEELTAIRTLIPIEPLIEEVLKLEQAGRRFHCPCCKTLCLTLKHSSNLLWCSSCERDFNAIDIVMHSRRCGFIHSVNLLKALLPSAYRSNMQKGSMRPERKVFRSGRG